MTMLPKYGNKPIEITLGQLITLTKPGKPRLKELGPVTYIEFLGQWLGHP